MTALLTQSRLASARSCQRLHHIRYELGYSALVELGGRKFGKLIHLGLETLLRAKMNGVSQDEAGGMSLAVLEGEDDPFERVKAEVLLTAYAVRWWNEPLAVLAVESEFCTELRNPKTGALSRTWQLGGKIDAIVRDVRDGRVFIMEHKTSAEDITPGSTYWRRLRMDTQVSVYFEGARSLGHDVAGCIYDVIGKPSIKPLKATPMEARKYTKDGRLYAAQREHDETPDEYKARLFEAVGAEPDRFLARGEVVRLEDEMTDALQDIWDTAKQIQEAKVAGRAPRNPGACVQYGRTCDFFDVCSGAAGLEDSSLFVRNANVHRELSLTEAPLST
jgi:hypothetical protein